MRGSCICPAAADVLNRFTKGQYRFLPLVLYQPFQLLAHYKIHGGSPYSPSPCCYKAQRNGKTRSMSLLIAIVITSLSKPVIRFTLPTRHDSLRRLSTYKNKNNNRKGDTQVNYGQHLEIKDFQSIYSSKLNHTAQNCLTYNNQKSLYFTRKERVPTNSPQAIVILNVL